LAASETKSASISVALAMGNHLDELRNQPGHDRDQLLADRPVEFFRRLLDLHVRIGQARRHFSILECLVARRIDEPREFFPHGFQPRFSPAGLCEQRCEPLEDFRRFLAEQSRDFRQVAARCGQRLLDDFLWRPKLGVAGAGLHDVDAQRPEAFLIRDDVIGEPHDCRARVIGGSGASSRHCRLRERASRQEPGRGIAGELARRCREPSADARQVPHFDRSELALGAKAADDFLECFEPLRWVRDFVPQRVEHLARRRAHLAEVGVECERGTREALQDGTRGIEVAGFFNEG
jgi:hypothetical protein